MPTPDQSSVYAAADGLAPRVRRQWLLAVASLQDDVSIGILSEAVLLGGLTQQLLKRISLLHLRLRPMVATIATVFEQSAARTEQEIVQRLELKGVFDIVNPRAVDAAAMHGANLVVEITQDVRESLRAIISRSISDGIAPREAAKLIRPLVGLTERQSIAVINYRTSLLESGASADKAQAAAARYATKLHRQRSDLIARTETIRASAAGQQAAWEDAQAQGLLDQMQQKKWLSAQDERRCPTCAALHGQVVGLHAQFQSIIGPVDAPPAHPACRCVATLVVEKRKKAA